MVQLKNRIAKKRQELEELEKQEAEQLARERKVAKKREEKMLLGMGYGLKKRLKFAEDSKAREENIALMRTLIKEHYTEGKPEYQRQMKQLDHLIETLEPLPQETTDSRSVAALSSDPLATPVAASIPGQYGLASANRGSNSP